MFSGVQCQDCFEWQLGKLKLQITKVSQLLSIWAGPFLNFREIEHTVSYKLFLIKMRVMFLTIDTIFVILL